MMQNAEQNFTIIQQLKQKREGVLVGAYWTHAHRGVIPNVGLKYIITGWISYA